jgi:hypothetical protein
MKRLPIALAAFALLTAPSSRVSAHNSWFNGSEVDPITKGICWYRRHQARRPLGESQCRWQHLVHRHPRLARPARTHSAFFRRTLVALNDLRRGLRHRPLRLRAIHLLSPTGAGASRAMNCRSGKGSARVVESLLPRKTSIGASSKVI